MKYLIIIAVLGAGYWIYQDRVSGTNNSNLSIAEKIATNGSVRAGEVLDTSKEMIIFTCKDDEVLKTWGSSKKKCDERITNFGEMCEERIFPDVEASIKTDAEAKGLMQRYNECMLPK